MEYQVSARKFRPGTFESLIGQPHVVQTLSNAITRKQVAHAYVFSGMRGVGKTTVARILAKALNCDTGPTTDPCETCESCVEITRGNSVDVIEIDGASNTGVDDVRELRENVKFAPFRGSYRIYIIDEVHMLSNSAFNALLKTLEEPPPHAVFIFATTEVHKIPATILSRCQHFTFRRIPRREIIARLQHVAGQNQVAIEERSLGAIARASDGSMRDALSLFDQAVAFGGTTITDQDIDSMLGVVPDELVRRLVQTVMQQNAAAAVSLVGEVLDSGYDLRAYCGEIVERMRNMLIAAIVPSRDRVESLIDLPSEEVEHIISNAQAFSVEQLQELLAIFSQVEDRLRSTAHPRFAFEVATIRAARLLNQTTAAPMEPTRPVPAAKPAGSPTQGKSPPPAPRAAATRPPSHPGTSQRPQGPTSTPPPVVKESPSSYSKAEEPWHVSIESKPEEHRPQATPKSPIANPTPARVKPEPAIAQILRPEDWKRVTNAMLTNHPNIGTFLEMGTVVKMEDSQVVIGFPKTASVACGRIQKEENRELVAKVCRDVTGASVQIRVIELTDSQASSPSMAQLRAKQQKQEDDHLLEEVRENPLVKQAMELFGGEVVKASRVPVKKEEA